jgi:hypothetical protein
MNREIVTKLNNFYDVPKNIFIDSLIPNYAKHLIDLINILCIDPSYAKNIPRIVDIIKFAMILHNNRSPEIYQVSILKINIGYSFIIFWSITSANSL